MSYDEYWYKSPYRAMFYKDAYKLKSEQKDEELWLQGVYIYEALCDVSPILHAFSKKGTKPLPFIPKPLSRTIVEKELSEEEMEQKVENERLIAKIHFDNLARQLNKRFKDK